MILVNDWYTLTYNQTHYPIIIGLLFFEFLFHFFCFLVYLENQGWCVSFWIIGIHYLSCNITILIGKSSHIVLHIIFRIFEICNNISPQYVETNGSPQYSIKLVLNYMLFYCCSSFWPHNCIWNCCKYLFLIWFPSAFFVQV